MIDTKFDDINNSPINIAKQQAIQFERSKNSKALLYTIVIAAILFIIFITVSWQKPEPELPLKEDLVEIAISDDIVNLGNQMEGKGDIQPLAKGDYAPLDPAPVSTQPEPNTTPPDDPLVDDNNNEEPTTVNKPTVKPPVTRVNPKPVANTIATNPKPNPTPAPPQPKGLFKKNNGTGTGGNNATTNNDSYSQGNTNGNGDKDEYNGSPTGSGSRITNANPTNRGEIERLAEQSGTNYKGKVKLVVRVDENGNVTQVLQNSPSPASKEAKTFANQVAYKLKYTKGADGRNIQFTLDFDF